MDAKLIMTVDQMKNHDAWLNMRKQGIGGSDAGVIAGLNKYKSPLQLWMEKTGQAEATDISNKPAVQAGIRLEPVVADWFQDVTGKKVHRCGTLQNKKYPWMLANVDRLIQGEDVGLEIKTTNAFSAKDWDGDGLPDSYYIQCLHYMMVTGLQGWWIAVLIGGQDFRYKYIDGMSEDVQRDMDALFIAEDTFWNVNVAKRIIPEIDGSKSTSDMLAAKYPGGMDEVLDLPTAAREILANRSTFEQQAAMAKDGIALCDNQLKAMMEDYETAVIDDYKVTWKPRKGAVTIDKKKLMADFPEAYDACSKRGKDTKYFKVTVKKSDKE